MTLAYEQIQGILHHEAELHAGHSFEHWELINEAWLVVQGLSTTYWAKNSVSWAMLNYITAQSQLAKRGNPNANIVSLSAPEEGEEPEESFLLSIMDGGVNPTLSSIERKDFVKFLWDNTTLDEQDLIQQRFYEGLSVRQIAQKFQITPECVYQRIERVFTRIKELMKSKG